MILLVNLGLQYLKSAMLKILFFFAIFPFVMVAQNEKIDLKKLHKSFTKSNSDDQLYLCNFETSNFWYNQFLTETQHTRPDSTNWTEVDPTGVMLALYHNHQTYSNYPVVNVSKEDAKEFCKWLTKKYNSNKKRKFKKVAFRLPTSDEWNTNAYQNCDNKSIFPFPKDGNHLKDKNGSLKANYKYIHESCLKEENGKLSNQCKNGQTIWINAQNEEGSIIIEGAQSDFTAPVDQYKQNKKMCHLVGNVFEMTETEIVGGSYNSTGYYLSRYSVPPNFKTPHPEVGFRMVMEIIEK